MLLRSERAFTLFELLVAIAIVGIIMGVVVSRMGDYLEIDMRKASNGLSSTIRYLYNKAATERLYVRLVFDIDERTYWVEATSDPMKISKGDEPLDVGGAAEEKGGKGAAAGATEEQAAEEEAAAASMMTEKPTISYPTPSFGQVDSFLLKPTKLPDAVFIKDIFVEHLPAAVEHGKAAIYFFPNGYVEHAIINFTNEDEDYFYSVETNPVSGAVSIENEYRSFEEK